MRSAGRNGGDTCWRAGSALHPRTRALRRRGGRWWGPGGRCEWLRLMLRLFDNQGGRREMGAKGDVSTRTSITGASAEGDQEMAEGQSSV